MRASMQRDNFAGIHKSPLFDTHLPFFDNRTKKRPIKPELLVYITKRAVSGSNEPL
jgi:hypothetical protein